jgi:hypothetical protein
MFREKPLLIILLLFPTVLYDAPLYAQDEKSSSWTASADLVSSYIWRGTRQGNGPHFQPMVEYSAGSFTGGVWGTFDLHGYKEVDLYLAYELPAGFSIGLQDYWIADIPWTDFSAGSGSHAFEASIGYDSENVTFYAGYILNEAGGAGSSGGDLYLESRFSFDYFAVFMGAGNGWHTEDSGFTVCCLGLEFSREIPVTDRFSVPVTAQMVYNPDSERMFFTVGLSLSTWSGD